MAAFSDQTEVLFLPVQRRLNWLASRCIVYRDPPICLCRSSDDLFHFELFVDLWCRGVLVCDNIPMGIVGVTRS